MERIKDRREEKKVQKLEKFKKKRADDIDYYQTRINLFQFQEQNEFLVKQGFTDLKRNFKALQKCKGSTDLALSILKDKDTAVKQKINEEIVKHNIAKEYEIISSKGSYRPRKIIKALLKTGRNVEKALDYLERKPDAKIFNIEERIKYKEERLDKFKNVSKIFEQKMLENNFTVQNDFLKSHGFYNMKHNFKVLENNKGDMNKALGDLQFKKIRSREVIEEVIESEGLMIQHQYLITKGFDNPRKNLQVLRKTLGIKEKALDLLTDKKQMKELPPEIILKNKGLYEKHLILSEYGLKNMKFNLKALIKFEGDTDAVASWLMEKQEKWRNTIELAGLSEQNKILEQSNFFNLKKNFYLLKKHNGNVKNVIIDYEGVLQEKRISFKERISGFFKDIISSNKEKKEGSEISDKIPINQSSINDTTGEIIIFAKHLIEADKILKGKLKENREVCLIELLIAFAKKKNLNSITLIFKNSTLSKIFPYDLAAPEEKGVFTIISHKHEIRPGEKPRECMRRLLLDGKEPTRTAYVVERNLAKVPPNNSKTIPPKDFLTSLKEGIGKEKFDEILKLF